MGDPLSSIASIVTIIQLAGTAMQYINDVKDASTESGKIVVELSSLYGLLFGLKSLAEHSDQDEKWAFTMTALTVPDGVLSQLKTTLERLMNVLKPVTGLKKARKALTWSFKKEEVDQMLRMLERYKSLIGLALQKDHIGLSRELERDTAKIKAGVSSIQQVVRVIAERQRGDAEIKILDWLSTFQAEKRHQDVLKQRLPGTGVWLLETVQFQAWYSSAHSENTLWCHGIPGAGKTVLSSIVVEKLQNDFTSQDVGIAFFYCDHRNHREASSQNILATLLRQLSALRTSLPESIIQLHTRFEKRQQEMQIEDLRATLLSVCQEFHRTFIVIDALDESDTEDRRTLLSSLKGLSTASTSYFLTSRPHIDDVKKCFGNCAQIRVEAVDSDIRAYLAYKIHNASDLEDFLDDELREEIMATILRGSQGMFLLPALQVKSVLDQTCKAEVRQAVRNLPKELNDTFKAILDRIYTQSKSRAELAMDTLKFVSHAKRPLGIDEVKQALAVNLNDSDLNRDYERSLKLILGSCAGLVVADSESSTIRLVHYSLQEYLEKERQNLFPEGEAEVAKICLTFLLFDSFGSTHGIPETELTSLLKSYPFLQYAARYWGDHARRTEDTEVQRLAVKLLKSDSRHLSGPVQLGQTLQRTKFRGWSRSRDPTSVTGFHVAASLGLNAVVQTLLRDETDHYLKTIDNCSWTALHAAAYEGHAEVVNTLVQAEFDIEQIDDIGCTPCYLAASNGHEAVVRILLDAGAYPDARAEYNWTPLHKAVDGQYENVVKLLLEHDAYVGARSATGMTPLHRAAGGGHVRLRIMKLLLDFGSDVDWVTIDGWTPLHGAAVSGAHLALQLLLDRGAGIDLFSDDGQVPLHRACRQGHELATRILIERGARLVVKDTLQRIPLHHAAEKGHVEIIRILLDDPGSRADQLNARAVPGNTAMEVATLSGQHRAARVLREYKQSLAGDETDDGLNEIEIALESGSEDRLKELVVKDAACLGYSTAEGLTLLHQAAAYGHINVMLLLLKQGVDVNTRSEHGWTACHSAARAGQVLALQTLLDHGGNISARTVDKQSVLHKACQAGDEACVRLLLQRRTYAGGMDVFARTPLHEAAEHGHSSIIKPLLRHGADAMAIDIQGETPEYKAMKAGHRTVVDLLRVAVDMGAQWQRLSSAMR